MAERLFNKVYNPDVLSCLGKNFAPYPTGVPFVGRRP